MISQQIRDYIAQLEQKYPARPEANESDRTNKIGHIHPETGRLCITLADFITAPDPDGLYGYTYNAEDADCGLDPWRMIDGAHALKNGKVETWLGSGTIRDLAPETPIYIQRPKTAPRTPEDVRAHLSVALEPGEHSDAVAEARRILSGIQEFFEAGAAVSPDALTPDGKNEDETFGAAISAFLKNTESKQTVILKHTVKFFKGVGGLPPDVENEWGFIGDNNEMEVDTSRIRRGARRGIARVAARVLAEEE